MLTIVYDKSDKDLPCICVMKAGERLNYACLKMVIGEQAELLYRALTEQDFKIKEEDNEKYSDWKDAPWLNQKILEESKRIKGEESDGRTKR